MDNTVEIARLLKQLRDKYKTEVKVVNNGQSISINGKEIKIGNASSGRSSIARFR